MEERRTRPIWNRPIGWLVALAVALALVVPIASAQNGTPSASPSASPGASPSASPVASPVVTPIASQPTIKTRDDPKLGTILTDSDGRTLYMFAKDGPQFSNCTDKCAQIWPPFTVNGNPQLADNIPGSVGVSSRADGVNQVWYNSHPLYYYSGDKTPGDTNGQGIGGVWSVVHPSNIFGTPEASPVASPAT